MQYVAGSKCEHAKYKNIFPHNKTRKLLKTAWGKVGSYALNTKNSSCSLCLVQKQAKTFHIFTDQ